MKVALNFNESGEAVLTSLMCAEIIFIVSPLMILAAVY
jgi:hypothetical protein